LGHQKHPMQMKKEHRGFVDDCVVTVALVDEPIGA
jgi:hypothetical protein